MNLSHKVLSSAIAILFLVSIIPFVTLKLSAPVEAANSWVKSPITFPNQKYILDSTVIKDVNNYKMWYTYLSMDMSVSQLFSDMKTLNLDNVLTALQNYQFDGFLNHLSEINSTALWTILNGMRTVIGYAESTDGKNWNVVTPNVLGTSGSFFSSVGYPSVIIIDDTHYKMWYTSFQSTLNQSTLSAIFTKMGNINDNTRKAGFTDLLTSTKTVIKYATSSDGHTSWNIAGTPALSATGGAWTLFDSVGSPSVIMETTTNYTMWYTRLNTDFNDTALNSILTKVRVGTTSISDLFGILDSSAFVIGRATSTDGGATFTYSTGNNKVLPGTGTSYPALWQSVADPYVIKTGSSYEMWYTNGTSNMTQSLLQNVITAVRNLNMSIPTLWNSMKTKTFADFISDLVKLDVSSLKTLLNQTSTTIGYATSSDGITWTVTDPSNLMGVATTPWSSVSAPSVWKTSSTLTEMWFFQGIDDLKWQNVVDRVLGADPGLGYASLTMTPTTTTTPPPGGGGGGPIGPVTVDGVTNITSIVNAKGVFSQDINVFSDDNNILLHIPTGTTGLDSNGAPLTQIGIIHLTTSPPFQANAGMVTLAYDFTPSGATFNPPVTLRFSYDPMLIPAGVAETSLQIAYYDNTTSAWIILPSTVDTTSHFIYAQIAHFTPYAVTYGVKAVTPVPTTPTTTQTSPLTTTPTSTTSITTTVKPATFSTSNLTVTPLHIKPGDTVAVSVAVTNTGDLQGVYTVILKVNGVAEDSHVITLAGGDSGNVNFTITKNKVGTYAISIDTLSASLVVRAPITTATTQPPPADKPRSTNIPVIVGGILGGIFGLVLALLLSQHLMAPVIFNISSLTIIPPVVKPGANTTVVVKITNTSNKQGTYKLVLRVNNKDESSRDVTLSKGSSETVNFTVVKNTPGIYFINIDKATGRLLVQEDPGVTSPETGEIKP